MTQKEKNEENQYMEAFKTFSVKHKNSNAQIEITALQPTRLMRADRFRALGVPIRFEKVKGNQCLVFRSINVKKVKPALEKMFKITVPKDTEINIILDAPSWKEAMRTKKEAEAEHQKIKQGFQKKASMQPHFYVMHSYLDWGDYSVNVEREIRLMRKPMEDEGENNPVQIGAYRLWNDSIRDRDEEWEKDFTQAGGKGKTKVSITDELAQKWIAFSKESNKMKRKEEEEKKAANQKAAAEKEAAEKARKEKIFSSINHVETEKIQHSGDGEVIQTKITVHHKSGHVYRYYARNIFDFGLAVNPEQGGLAINVNRFIENNAVSFDTALKRKEYRKKHPTKTGWGWDRNFCEGGETWVEMDTEEVQAYKAALESVPNGMKGIRM